MSELKETKEIKNVKPVENKQDNNALFEFQLNRMRLIIGALLLVLIILIHAFAKELPIWVFAIPSFLFGLDFTKFINGRK